MRWYSYLAGSAALVLGGSVAAVGTTARVKWPLRVQVTGAANGAAAFRAFTAGGGLWVVRPGNAVVPLAPRDTLRATAPAEFPGDVTRGSVVFLATGPEELQVTVWRQGQHALPVAGRGRRLTVRMGAYGPEVSAQ
jgi:hypothetical protein